MTKILIGIDDTDNEVSRGTGHLARRLYEECQNKGMKPIGVTRHQFPTDPRIPYTSHNSGACIAVICEQGLDAADFAFDFIANHAATGSDPGLCLAKCDDVNDDVIQFSKTATKRIVTMQEAFTAARSASICLRGLGGSCLGVIGALASVGLHADGNEGRFIDLPGLRQLSGQVNAHTFNEMGIQLKYKCNGRIPQPQDAYDTLGWVRPGLANGKPVLSVEWSNNKNAWIPIDRKKNRPLE